MFAKHAKAVLRLTRIEHSIMLVIAVIAAELIVGAGRLPSLAILLPSLITPIFISMGAFAINDYFDVEVDRANDRLDRPIVSGAISKGHAMYVVIASFAIGVLVSWLINPTVLLIAFIFAVLSILYSYKLKETLLIGNIYIALSMAIPFIYGDYAISNTLNMVVLIIAAIIVLAGLGREIQGIIRDYEGDRKMRDVKSLPLYVGIRNSALTAMFFYVLAIILSIYLFFFTKPFYMNYFYLLSIAIVDLILLYVGYSYLAIKKNKEKKMFRLTRNLSLAAMALALIIFTLIAAIF